MNAKERVLKSLAHEEPDRIPMFELAFSTKLASDLLGRKAFFPRSGGSSLKNILMHNARGRRSRMEAIQEGTLTQIEVYNKFGYDIMPLIPTEFLQAVSESFGLFGSNFLLDVKIEELGCNKWKVTGENGFWSIHVYNERSDAFFAMDDTVKQGGIKALERYINILESRDAGLNEHTIDALESVRIAVQSREAMSGDLFILGHCDVCMPTAAAYFDVFLEAMAVAPEIIERYFGVTTRGLIPILKEQIRLGVDGILAANDWCFKSGPIISPEMFKRFLVPHLKQIADETHKAGLPFIKHLDGNVNKLLPMLVDDVGIDAYHSIEPTAGMNIFELKEKFGKRISLWGNVDCGSMLVDGTPPEIREYVKKLINSCAVGGGFVLSSSNAIHDAIPLQNLEMMIRTCREYGKYPIRLT